MVAGQLPRLSPIVQEVIVVMADIQQDLYGLTYSTNFQIQGTQEEAVNLTLPPAPTVLATVTGTVTDGTVNGFKPGDITKITVVIWLEGNDPDCTDNILGGQFKLDMIFDIVGMGES